MGEGRCVGGGSHQFHLQAPAGEEAEGREGAQTLTLEGRREGALAVEARAVGLKDESPACSIYAPGLGDSCVTAAVL